MTGLFKDRFINRLTVTVQYSNNIIAEYRLPCCLPPTCCSASNPSAMLPTLKPPIPPQALHQTRVLNPTSLACIETVLLAISQAIITFWEAQACRSTTDSPVLSLSGNRDSFASSQVQNHKHASLLANNTAQSTISITNEKQFGFPSVRVSDHSCPPLVCARQRTRGRHPSCWHRRSQPPPSPLFVHINA